MHMQAGVAGLLLPPQWSDPGCSVLQLIDSGHCIIGITDPPSQWVLWYSDCEFRNFRKVCCYINLHKVCQILLCEKCQALTTLCVDNHEKATKVLSSWLAGIVHVFVHSSETLWHMADAMFSFEFHRLPRTKQCRPLLSKRLYVSDFKIACMYVAHKKYNYAVQPFRAGKQQLTTISV